MSLVAPTAERIFSNVYAEPHPLVDEQRAWLAAYESSFEDGVLMAANTVENLPMAKAINEGLRAALAADDRVLLMGEDIGTLGGVFRVTEGLKAEFGENRVLDTPLAESAIVGTAIGLAMRGYRPVCEIQFDGFIFPGFDQITSQLAKLTFRNEGAQQFPVVIRVPYGGHIGAVEHHQESPEAYFAHTAGLRVVSPATPNDGYWMIQEAIASNDPVMFFEPKSRYWQKGDVDRGRVRHPVARESRRARRNGCHPRRPRSDGVGAAAGRRHRRRGGHEPRGDRPAGRCRRSTTRRFWRRCRRPAGSWLLRRRPAT